MIPRNLIALSLAVGAFATTTASAGDGFLHVDTLLTKANGSVWSPAMDCNPTSPMSTPDLRHGQLGPQNQFDSFLNRAFGADQTVILTVQLGNAVLQAYRKDFSADDCLVAICRGYANEYESTYCDLPGGHEYVVQVQYRHNSWGRAEYTIIGTNTPW